MTSLIGSALTLGLLGSTHCAVMCGPLAAAACSGCTSARWQDFARYQSGRLLGYAFAGALFGAAGARALRLVPLAAAQTALALAIAAAALIRGGRLLAGAFAQSRRGNGAVSVVGITARAGARRSAHLQ